MAYIVPKALIKQEFTQVPVFGDQPLAALIIGPQYDLHRYSDADEKPSTAVTHPDSPELKNAYQADDNVTYAFPNQEAGTFVDTAFTKVYFEEAQVEYYPSAISATGGDVLRVAHPTINGAYYSNRIRATDLVFKTGNGVDRSEDFANRDVKAGDVLIVTNDVDAEDFVEVKVKALHASKTAASLSAVTNDTGNAATASSDFNNAVVWVGTGSAPADAPVNGSSAYAGHISKGIVADTYTVEVTAVGAALTDTRFKITSANGAFSAKTAQALNGSDELIIDTDDSAVIKLDYTAATAPALGDKYTLSVTAAVVPLVNASTIVKAGTFTGTQDTTYSLRVVRGGPLYTGSNGDVCARIAITSDQLDTSPTVNVASATAFRVGSYDLTVTISAAVAGGGLVLNDVYHFTATAAAPDAYNIVETFEALPATLIDNSLSYEITSMRLTHSFEVPSVVDADAEIFNWEQDGVGQTITVYQDIQTTNADIVQGNIPLNLDVKKAKVFVSHRDLVVTNSLSVGSVTSTDEIEARLGKIDVDNPLAQGVYFAVLNSNAAPTYFVSVLTDDLDGYNAALGLSRKSENYYGITPLTFDRTVQDAVVASVNALSTPEEAKWRVAWLSAAIEEDRLIYDLDPDGVFWKATITDDPFATGTQYSLVTVAGATFVADGIRPTDELQVNFRYNDLGQMEWDTYVVAEVRTETTLVLATALATPINVAQPVKIQRVYTKDEQIEALKAVGGEFNNRRVRSVFPSTAKAGGVEYPGYFVAAALAGLRAGVVPHQGLTNTEVLGFDDLEQVVTTFTETQLNNLADAGYWIVTQVARGATPYVRHQLTTDRASLNASEDSVTTNVDSISYGLRRAVAPFIGTYNIHTKALTLLRSVIDNELYFRLTSTYTVRAGNQLNGYEILKFQQNATFKDRVDVDIKLDVPYPMNFITITLIV